MISLLFATPEPLLREEGSHFPGHLATCRRSWPESSMFGERDLDNARHRRRPAFAGWKPRAAKRSALRLRAG
jgi:hypothetical protein